MRKRRDPLQPQRRKLSRADGAHSFCAMLTISVEVQAASVSASAAIIAKRVMSVPFSDVRGMAQGCVFLPVKVASDHARRWCSFATVTCHVKRERRCGKADKHIAASFLQHAIMRSAADDHLIHASPPKAKP